MAEDVLMKLMITLGLNTSGVKEGASGAQGALTDLGKGFEQLTGISLKTATALGAVTVGLGAAKQFIADSVKETQALGLAQHDLATKLGVSAEEAGKIIQVADDYRVSIGEVESALGMALKNGFAPTIDSLARLSDEFKATADPVERTKKMVEVFGRQWESLIPLLEAGGDAIRRGAQEAEDAGLVLSGKATQDAIDYTKAVDNLADAWLSVKLAVGQVALPALTDFINKQILGEGAGSREVPDWARKQAAPTYTSPLETPDVASNISGLTDFYTGYNNELEIAAQNIQNQNAALEIERQRLEEVRLAMADATLANSDMSMGLMNASWKDVVTSSIDALGQSLRDGTISQQEYQVAFEDIAKSAGLVNDKSLALAAALPQLNQYLADGVIPASSFKDALKDVTNQANSGSVDWEGVVAKYGEPVDTSASLGTMKGDIENVTIGVEDLGEAGVTSFTDIETSAADLGKTGTKELVETYKNWKAQFVDPTVKALQSVNQELRNIMQSINDLNAMTIMINAFRPGLQMTGTIGQGHYATGGAFTVPSGYSNDSYGPIWLSSGEHVSVTPSNVDSGEGEIGAALRSMPGKIGSEFRSALAMFLEG